MSRGSRPNMDSNTIPPTSGETNHDQAGTKAVEVIPPKPRKIFVSHATKDRERVEQLILRLLRRHEIDYFFAPESIVGSEEWHNAIMSGLKEATHFIVVLTPDAVESKWVRAEVKWAFENLDNGRIFPIHLYHCDIPKLHLPLLNVQYFDFLGNPGKAAHDLLKQFDATPSRVAQVIGEEFSESLFRNSAYRCFRWLSDRNAYIRGDSYAFVHGYRIFRLVPRHLGFMDFRRRGNLRRLWCPIGNRSCGERKSPFYKLTRVFGWTSSNRNVVRSGILGFCLDHRSFRRLETFSILEFRHVLLRGIHNHRPHRQPPDAI